jgi:hypothetical protein
MRAHDGDIAGGEAQGMADTPKRTSHDAEQVTSALARNPDLTVIGRISARQANEQNLDLRAIAEALNVDYLIEGSVRKAGGRVVRASRRCTSSVMCDMAISGTKNAGMSAKGKRCIKPVLTEAPNPGQL